MEEHIMLQLVERKAIPDMFKHFSFEILKQQCSGEYYQAEEYNKHTKKRSELNDSK